MNGPKHDLKSKTTTKRNTKQRSTTKPKSLEDVLDPWAPATKKLIADLGPKYTIEDEKGALVLRWEPDPKGDGIVVGRLSDPDSQGGDQVLAQVREQLAYLTTRGRTARYVLVTTDNSGGRWLEDRPDFANIVREIRRGTCRWVSYSRADRLTRNLLEGVMFTTFLRETKTTLILCDLGEIDWRTSDKLLLQMMMMVSEADRDSIEARMTAGQYRGLEAGKPMGGALPFGIRRAKDGFAEVDPEKRAVVRAILNEFGTFDGKKGSGTREFAASLCHRGGRKWKVNASQVKAVLQSPIWVSGAWIQSRGSTEFTIRVRGAESPLIPIERWQLNQQLLEMRAGREKTSAVGLRPLKDVVLRHADCGGILELERSRVGETNKRLRHRSGTSACGCTFPEDAVQRAVIGYLKKLATDPDAVAAANRRAWPEWASVLSAGRSSFDPMTPDVAREMRKEERALRTWFEKSGVEPWGPYRREFEKVRDLCPATLHVIAQLERAEAFHDVQPRIPFWRSKVWFEADVPALRDVFVSALPAKTPATPAQRLLRAQLIKRCVSEIEIHGRPGSFTLTIRGTRVPRDWALEPLSPVHFAALELEYAAQSRLTEHKQRKTGIKAAEYAATAPSHYGLGAVAASEMWEAMGYEVGPSWVSEPMPLDYDDSAALSRARKLRAAAKRVTPKRVRGATKSHSAGRLRKLIDDGFLVAGEELTLTHHQKKHPATLLADGSIIARGKVHATPSAASQAVKGLKADPGMHSWHVTRDAEPVSLKDIEYYSTLLSRSRVGVRSRRKKV